MKAVLDTNPIISLSIINKLPILASLFSSIYIPKAVWKELSDNKAILPFSGIKSFFNTRKIKEISKNNNFTPFEIVENPKQLYWQKRSMQII